MYYLLYLDRTDDLSSVRKRLVDLNVGTVTEVGLVIPADNMAFAAPTKRDLDTRRLPSRDGGGEINFRLLKRHAGALSMKLAIIAGNKQMRLQAGQADLPTFSKVNAYRSYTARQRVIRQNKPIARIVDTLELVGTSGSRLVSTSLKVTMIGFLVTLIIAGFYALVPSATVTVAPTSENLEAQLMIRADPGVRNVSLTTTADGAVRIPARVLQKTITATMAITTTGVRSTPNTRASGQVTFFNKTNQEINIPRNTVVVANGGQRYQTIDDAKLPPVLWNMRRVAVVAEQAGSAANIEELQIKHVVGPLDLQVVVLNEVAIRGGDDRRVTVVSQEDKENLHNQLSEQLEADVKNKLQNDPELGGPSAEKEGGGRLTMIPNSMEVKPLDEIWSHNVDQETLMLTLTMKVRAVALAFDYSHITELSDQYWASRVKPGFEMMPASRKLAPLKVVHVEGNTALLQLTMHGTMSASIDQGNIREIVRGRSASEAQQVLASSYNLSSEPRIDIQPGWSDRALRVEVVIAP